ncbi:hypothetical protein [Bradyrhizobium manausense]|uniref:hypothetical protein n=1 Tax=Bradyrhizobium manausense TaxID=989370 RepID=UPI001BA87B4D|nr:hypothetical protein [Bradyrhizobium manausense]MBR0720646.1 hypothetical protein [Bradyrhizobium manausense]
MTKNSINAKCEALELHELSAEELDAASGGDKSGGGDKSTVADRMRTEENMHQVSAMQLYRRMLEKLN